MKKPVLRFKTIILSDVHLGTVDCKIDEVNHFLKHTECDKLILNGDIIDGWALKRGRNWNKEHTHFIRRILKKAEKKNTQVIYLAGNHDDVLRSYLPVFFDNFRIEEQHIHHGSRGDYLCIHGDVFDAVTTNSKWLAVLGDIGYVNLLRLNRIYAKYRAWRGKEYYSLSKAVKARVKTAVSYLSRFEDHLQSIAQKHACCGIICGHIHTAADKMVGETHYLNSGDWVESLTAIVEHHDGRMEVLEYKDFCMRLNDRALKNAAKKNKKRQGNDAQPESDFEPVSEDFAWAKEEESLLTA